MGDIGKFPARTSENIRYIAEGEAKLDRLKTNIIASTLSDVMIRVESKWNPEAKSPVAEGLGQLTDTVFQDMENQPNLYRTRMKQLGVSPESAEILMRGDREKIRTNTKLQLALLLVYKDILSDTFSVRPKVSIDWIPSSMFRQWLRRSFKAFDDNMTFVEDTEGLESRISFRYFQTQIQSYLLPNESIPEFNIQSFREFLKILQKNPVFRRELRAVRYYNRGDTQSGYEKYGEGLSEKQVYAILIGYISIHLLEKKSPGLLMK